MKNQYCIKNGSGWSWYFGNSLCHWVVASKDVLLSEGKPSPSAKPVYCAIIPMSLYKKLLRPNAKVRGRITVRSSAKVKKGGGA